MTEEQLKDLVVLVADKNMQEAIAGLLGRPEALGIRTITLDVYAHPNRDPGCLREARTFLRSFVGTHAHALVMFDKEGCGQQGDRVEIADGLTKELRESGWGDRASVVVLDPELEVWVWSSSPHVAEALGWQGRVPTLHDWLQKRGHLGTGEYKPARPKEAMEDALREVKRPRSSAIYRQLAERVSLRGHREPAFLQLCAILQAWFPAAAPRD